MSLVTIHDDSNKGSGGWRWGRGSAALLLAPTKQTVMDAEGDVDEFASALLRVKELHQRRMERKKRVSLFFEDQLLLIAGETKCTAESVVVGVWYHSHCVVSVCRPCKGVGEEK